MCDTLGKLGHNFAFFAKNSDPSPNEVQIMEYHPAVQESGECFIRLDRAEGREHPVYGDLLNAYIEENRTVFEKVEVNSACYHTCPENSCIFRTTRYYRLNHQPSVYCWVNLVYNENWQEILKTEEYRHCVERGLVKELAPNWCIVIEYGY